MWYVMDKKTYEVIALTHKEKTALMIQKMTAEPSIVRFSGK